MNIKYLFSTSSALREVELQKYSERRYPLFFFFFFLSLFSFAFRQSEKEEREKERTHGERRPECESRSIISRHCVRIRIACVCAYGREYTMAIKDETKNDNYLGFYAPLTLDARNFHRNSGIRFLFAAFSKEFLLVKAQW